jgi:excisionase family DNA binding protein
MNDDDIQPLTLTVEQAAKLLGIGRSTAYELVHTGDIPSLRLGRRIVIPIDRLNRVLIPDAPPEAGAAERVSTDAQCRCSVS